MNTTLKYIFLFLSVFSNYSNIIKAQDRSMYDIETTKKIAYTLCNSYVQTHVSNISEIIKYNQPLAKENPNYLLNIDTVLRISVDSSINLVNCHVLGTNYFFLFFVDLANFKCEMLNNGYEMSQKLNIKGLKALLKYKNILQYNNIDYLIIDILTPNSYSYFKIINGISVEEISRQLYSLKNLKNIEFANTLINLGNCSPKAEYLICNKTVNKFYYISIKKNKIKIYCPKKVTIKSIFGAIHYFDGPKVVYCPVSRRG